MSYRAKQVVEYKRAVNPNLRDRWRLRARHAATLSGICSLVLLVVSVLFGMLEFLPTLFIPIGASKLRIAAGGGDFYCYYKTDDFISWSVRVPVWLVGICLIALLAVSLAVRCLFSGQSERSRGPGGCTQDRDGL